MSSRGAFVPRGWPVVVATAALVLLGIARADPPPEALGVQGVQLGARLFFDPQFSQDGQTACASCHQPARAFADGRVVAVGAFGRQGTRNTPSLIGVAERRVLTWDGRETQLPRQALVPFTHPKELGLAGMENVLQKLAADREYARAFADVFKSEKIDAQQLSRALAAYLATLVSGPSAFSRFVDGDIAALSPAARNGMRLFGAAGCAECHRMDEGRRDLTDDAFHRAGVGLQPLLPKLGQLTTHAVTIPRADLDAEIAGDREIAALGHFLVTRNPQDIGAYRTPALRNVAITGPYMHDGSVPTLEAAVDLEIYYRSIARGQPVILTPKERADLVLFLNSLTEDRLLPTRSE